MKKKCLILSGSPKLGGNTAKLIKIFEENCDLDCETVYAYPLKGTKGISGCLDCGACGKNKFCAVHDEFDKILKDDFDVFVIASPIFMSNLPGPMINLVSRFNFDYNNHKQLQIKTNFKEKQGVLILLGGGGACKPLQGQSNEDNPFRQAQFVFKKTNSILLKENVVLCLNVDKQKVEENEEIIQKVKRIAQNVGRKKCDEMTLI